MGVLVLMVSAQARASNVRFYQNLLERGKTAFQGGQYETAARNLKIAAFGFLESLPDYETAEIYLALANHRLGRDDQARNAIESVMRAEQVKPTYRTLALDPRIRSAFETVIAALLPSRSLGSTAPPTTVRQQPTSTPPSTGSGDAPAVAPTPAVPVPMPTVPVPVPATTTSTESTGSEPPSTASSEPTGKAESTDTTPSTEAATPPNVEPAASAPAAPVTESAQAAPPPSVAPAGRTVSTPEIRDLEALLAKQPDSTSVRLALADAHLRAGNLDAASELATKVLDAEPTNAIANTYLARIARQHGDTSDAISHYQAARASGPLSDEDQGALFVCYVTTGDYASARSLEPSLTEMVRHEPDVAKAIEQLQSATKKTPANSSPGRAAPPPRPSETNAGSPSRQADRSPPPAPDPNLVTESPTSSPPDTEDVFVSIREARRDIANGNCASAAEIYHRLLALPSLHRYVLLAIGRGLENCQVWADSLQAYKRAEPLRTGEEEHMFRVAVDQYQLGNLAAAREYLDRALPNLEMTDEVRHYVDLIRGTR